EDFLRAYVAGIQLIKKDASVAEKSFSKWLRESDANLVKKTVEVYSKIFKTVPNVPDRGIENVLKDLASRRPVSKEFIGRYDLFRDNGPLDRVVAKP
ncbi:MAG TPA: hypothetical protein VKH62_10630, partial [Candidatus Binatia bacterium]|nr:hypothetical protein [Candidatus Binatia bacterium]